MTSWPFHLPHRREPRRRRDSGEGLVWVIGGFAALAVAFLAVFLVFTVLADVGIEDEEVVATPEVREGSLEIEAYEAIDIGTPKGAVLSALRPALPVDTRVVQRAPEEVAAECVYYERYGGRAGETFRFCFDGGVLVDKTLLLAGDPGAESELVEEPVLQGDDLES